MAKEKNDLVKVNKNHVKLLTSKYLVQVLSEMVEMRQKEGFQMIKRESDGNQKFNKCMKRFFVTFNNYYEDRKKYYLRKWFRSALNFPAENSRMNNLVERKSNLRMSTKFFHAWRAAYLSSVRAYDDKLEAIRVLKNIF
jgi:hypothetical protein